MKAITKTLIVFVLLFVAIQLIRPDIPEKPASAELQVPPEVKQVLERSCFSCHSDERRLAWFDQVVPAYWLVRADILTARRHLNFSTLGAKPVAAQKAVLYEAVNMIQLGAMPLPQFLKLHPEAHVSDEDLKVLKTYLGPWTTTPNEVSSEGHAGASASLATPVSLSGVRPELNGLPFEPDFENWKMIATTDRGDNSTFRFILGNETAIKAAQSGEISPWPDGTRFAKIAWQQERGADGLVYPGKFIQIEFMVKDASRYKNTDGWGWGRWRGLDLKPYGNDAHFVDECTTCHMPVRGDDSVYTLPMTTARVPGDQLVNNRAASLPSSLPYQPLGWNAITMYVDPGRRTIATLFGNEAAMQAVRASRASHQQTGPSYPPGSVLALVTWAQRDDPHWFGARIPDLPESIEFLEVGPAGGYRRFSATGLVEAGVTEGLAAERSSFLMSLPPAQLP